MRWKKFSLAVLLVLLLAQVSSATDLEPPLKVVWTSRLGIASTDIGPQSIDLIASDVIYTNYEVLKAIDANDGKLLWSKDWSAGLAYKDGVLYAARAFSPSLYALDARTGEEIWRKEYPELEEVIKSDYVVRYYLGILNDTLLIVTNGIYVPDVPAFDSSGNPRGHNVFHVMAVDMDGNLKWQQNHTGDTIFDWNPQIISKNIVIPYGTSSPDFTDYKNNLIALNLTTGETVWEIKNIRFEGNPISYKDLFFIDKLYENNSYYILAVSQATGETVWKRRVGDLYGNILAIKDNKLFVNSETIKVLNTVNGETIDQYSSTLDSSLLRFFPFVISDNILYVVTTGPSPYIYSIDLNTGKLLWKGGKGGISPYIYKNRLYLIIFGQLYAYEYGIEEKDEGTKYIYFSMLGVPLILVNLFLRIKKYDGKLQRGFGFSSLLTLVAYSVFLVSGIPSFINILEISIPSLDTDWIFYLLFPIVGVIAGTLTGTRTKSKFLIGAATGATPYLIALIVSILLQPDLFKYIILSLWPLMISLEMILVIGLIFGVVCGLFSLIISGMRRKKEQ